MTGGPKYGVVTFSTNGAKQEKVLKEIVDTVTNYLQIHSDKADILSINYTHCVTTPYGRSTANHFYTAFITWSAKEK